MVGERDAQRRLARPASPASAGSRRAWRVLSRRPRAEFLPHVAGLASQGLRGRIRRLVHGHHTQMTVFEARHKRSIIIRDVMKNHRGAIAQAAACTLKTLPIRGSRAAC